jgi:hypothetical protein
MKIIGKLKVLKKYNIVCYFLWGGILFGIRGGNIK